MRRAALLAAALVAFVGAACSGDAGSTITTPGTAPPSTPEPDSQVTTAAPTTARTSSTTEATTTVATTVPPSPTEPGPVARFNWSLPDRYNDSWASWGPLDFMALESPVPHTEAVYGYDPAFVNPTRWRVVLDACGSDGGVSTIASFEWELRQGDQRLDTATVDQCRLENTDDQANDARLDVPALGVYSVTLTVETADGAEASTTGAIEVKDLLVVSIGDSSASGEGNEEGVWADRRCHRSRTSGHSLAAALMEAQDDKSSVTFLSLACSGAKVSAGVLAPFAGQEPIEPPALDGPDTLETVPLEPQLDAMVRSICGQPRWDCPPDQQRRVDVLLVSAGVNELGFGNIISSCAVPASSCLGTKVTEAADLGLEQLVDGAGAFSCRSVQELLGAGLAEDEARATSAAECAGVGHGYQLVADRLAAFETTVGSVYVVTYPGHPFGSADATRGGCGLLFGISAAEASWMAQTGDELNGLIVAEAERLGWTPVDGVTEVFAGHDYCAAESWFVEISVSLLTQGNLDGSVHPNRAGHEAIADLIVRAVLGP